MKRERSNVSFGKVLKDQLHLKEMPTVELSVRLNLPVDQTKQLIDEELQVTPEIATGLERIFDAPASFWMELTQPNNDKVFYMEQA